MEEKFKMSKSKLKRVKSAKGCKKNSCRYCYCSSGSTYRFYIHNEMKYQSTDDAYVETTTVNVSPRVSGQIEEVYVTDNQHVKAGDLVAVIDAEDYKIRLEQATLCMKK